MVHNTADKVAEAKLAAITHETLKEEIVPDGYVKKHGMDYDLIDYSVDQLIRMFGEPDDYSRTKTDPESGRRFMGYAIWRYPTPRMDNIPKMPFLKKIFVKDHLLLHDDHIDFLFTKTDIAWNDPKTLKQANKISESIYINQRYETCTTGCHFLMANLASHYLAWRVAMGVIPVWKARESYKSLMKAGKRELENAKRLGDELRMPVHATLIRYLNTMYDGYAKESEVEEEIVTQSLEAIDEATGGDFINRTPEEMNDIISRRGGRESSRSTSVGTVTVSSGDERQQRRSSGFTLTDTRPRTPTQRTPGFSLTRDRPVSSKYISEKNVKDDEYEDEEEFEQPKRAKEFVKKTTKKLYM